MPEVLTRSEALPSIETNPPSPALKARIAHGIFDENQPITATLPTKVDKKTFDALHNQNVAQRKKDADTFAQKFQNAEHPLTSDELRNEQMKAWSFGVISELGSDLHLEGRGDKTAAILKNKLNIPLEATEADGKILLNQLYDADTKTEGNFYKNFCTGNMNENLANALTLDDMMHLKSFLTKWMLGSDTAFNALIALKTTMDDLASPDPARKQALSQHATTKVTGDLDNQILDFYRKGLGMKDEKNQPTQPTEQQQSTDREVASQRKKDVFENEANHSAEAHKKLMSEMTNALEEEKIAGKGKLGATIQETAQGTHGKEVIRDGYVVYIPSQAGEKIITVGDIHGDLATIQQILEKEQFFEDMESGNPKIRLVFQGDLVDRGPKSIEVMTAIMKLKTLYKDRVHIIAADHDTISANVLPHDFPNKLQQVFGAESTEIYQMYANVFGNMPKMVVTGNGIVIVHGGPAAEKLNLAQIGRLEDTDTKGVIAEQFSWSDPIAHPSQQLEEQKAQALKTYEYVVDWAATQPNTTDESIIKLPPPSTDAFKLKDLKTAASMLRNLPAGEYPNPARAGSGLMIDALFSGLLQYDEQAFDSFMQRIGGKVMIRGHQTSDSVDGGQPNLFGNKLWTIHSTGSGSPESAYVGREDNPSYATFDLGTNIATIGQTNIRSVW